MESLSEKGREKLAIFIGNWTVTGQDFKDNPNGMEISGEEIYEWLPGSFLLVNNWCKNVGEVTQKGTGLIGINFSHHAFSSEESENTVYTRTYKIEPKDKSWLILGENERAIIEFSDNGRQFIQKWEYTNDGANWTLVRQLTGVKVNSV